MKTVKSNKIKLEIDKISLKDLIPIKSLNITSDNIEPLLIEENIYVYQLSNKKYLYFKIENLLISVYSVNKDENSFVTNNLNFITIQKLFNSKNYFHIVKNLPLTLRLEFSLIYIRKGFIKDVKSFVLSIFNTIIKEDYIDISLIRNEWIALFASYIGVNDFTNGYRICFKDFDGIIFDSYNDALAYGLKSGYMFDIKEVSLENVSCFINGVGF